MTTMRVRFSLRALSVSAGFLLLAAAAYLQHVHSVGTNPADSGESGILFFLFSLPWGLVTGIVVDLLHIRLPNDAPYVLVWAEVGLNAVVLYLMAGGLRRTRKEYP